MQIRNVSRNDALVIGVSLPFHIMGSWLRHTNDTLGQIMRAVGNWWSAVFIFLGVKRSAILHYKNGVEFTAEKKDLGKVVSLSEFNNLPERVKKELRIKIYGDSATMYVRGRKLSLDLEVANPVAIEVSTREHSMIDVKGRDVVDVGAYVDDTAIYYAVYGRARHVYAFEPFPYLFRKGVENVKSNKLDKQITTYNLAVAGETGRVALDSGFTSFNMVRSSGKKRGVGVRVVSLDSVVKHLRIRHAALKVDCEGCEYGIFAHSSSATLRSFDLIHVEYHYGYSDIVERLHGEGFRVTHTKPIFNFRGFGARPMLNGHIIATRK